MIQDREATAAMNECKLLDGKLALITGAGVGIGEGVAYEFARQGAAVVLHYASSDRALFTAQQIRDLGGRALAVQGDLGKVEDCRRVVETAADFLGGIDILINNAGATKKEAFAKTTQETFDRIFNINLRGYFFCAQEAARRMIERGGGNIVNLTSVHAFAGIADFSVYGSTKGAIVAFTRQLAHELIRHHIRVNAIGPGHIEVPRHLSDPHYTRELGNQRVPWGRVGLPADVAQVAAFLASDLADFVTGQVLFVDGGLTSKLAITPAPVVPAIQPRPGEGR
jgi:NAD(P)-dependent dehydrogenase (short-subunit alcohol dehydrogenase family)